MKKSRYEYQIDIDVEYFKRIFDGMNENGELEDVTSVMGAVHHPCNVPEDMKPYDTDIFITRKGGGIQNFFGEYEFISSKVKEDMRLLQLAASDREMQGILDDALACVKDLGWKFLRLPNQLQVWTPGNNSKYNTFHFDVVQVNSFEYHISYWNSMDSNVRGGMRDIKGSTRDKVFGVIANHSEYDKKHVAFKEVLKVLENKRIRYLYMHEQGFEIRYRVGGLEHYLRVRLTYSTNVEHILEEVKRIPKGKPKSEKFMTSSLNFKEWR